VQLADGRRMRANIAQTAQVFPGIGLGAIMSRTTRIRDEMVIAAAQVRSWPYVGDVWTCTCAQSMKRLVRCLPVRAERRRPAD
jgi:Malic enzyme, NAD binding domain